MNSNQTQTELRKLEARRDELARQLETQRAVVQNAQRALVEGQASPGDVAATQGEERALGAALDEVECQIKVVSARLNADKANELRAARRARALELGALGEAALAAHDAAFSQACAMFSPLVDTMLNERARLVELRREFEPLDLELRPSDEAGVDLTAIRGEWRHYHFDQTSECAAPLIHAFEWIANVRDRKKQFEATQKRSREHPTVDSWDLGYEVQVDDSRRGPKAHRYPDGVVGVEREVQTWVEGDLAIRTKRGER